MTPVKQALAVCLLVLTCLLPVSVQGSAKARVAVLATPQPQEITVADGLPSSTITAITEDQLGYLWLASADGLARFDGRDYRIWRSEDGLRDNYLWSLHVDAQNQLWVGTRTAGLVRFSADRRQLRYFDRSTHPLLGSNTIFAIASTQDGALWFGTDNAGLYRLDAKERLTRFSPQAGNASALPSNKVTHLLVDGQGDLWVGTEEGVARWTGSGFEQLDMGLLPDRRVNSLRIDLQGQIWVGTPSGSLVRGRDGQVRLPSLQAGEGNTVLQMMIQDRHGDYWFDTARDVMRSSDGVTPSRVPFFSTVVEDQVAKVVSFVFQDRDGGLWFSMLDGGLWHLPANWRQFVQLRGKRTEPQGLHNPRVESLSRSSRGGLWVVGTGGDLDHLDPVTGEVEHHVSSRPGQLWIRSVIEDPQGYVWIGRSGELERYDPRSARILQRWTRQTEHPAMMGAVRRMVMCGQDHLWLMSGESGLQKRNLEGAVLWSSAGSEGDPGSNDILDLFCGPDDALWLATRRGLMRWETHLQRFDLVPGSPQEPIHAAHLDGQSVLWLGQAGALTQYSWRSGRLERVDRIDENSGFPPVLPVGVVVDPQGIIWVASRRGLLRVDPASRNPRLLGVADGLRSQEFMPGTLGLTDLGQLYAASEYGVVLVQRDAFLGGQRRPPLVVEHVQARQDDRIVDLTHQSPLHIPYGMRDIQITARLLSFVDASSTSYRFKLEGYDSDWIDVGSSGQRLFSRLEPGNRTLSIQARTPDQTWSQVYELGLQIDPPWWKSLPGLLVMGMGSAGIGLLGVLLYRRRLQRSNELSLARTRRELAEQASEAKTRFLANFGHEVRTPLTGVLGMSELLMHAPLPSREHGYAKAINQAGDHLLRLVNDALDLARIEAGKLELREEWTSLPALLEQVMGLMAPLASSKQLTLSRVSDVQGGIMVRADALRLRQILLNLMGNAIKFTARGHVTLRWGAQPSHQGIWIEVVDTGPGLSEEQQARLFKRFEQAEGVLTARQYGGSGLGLAISKELALAMGGGLSVRSRPGEGACFRFEAPLQWQPEADTSREETPSCAEGGQQVSGRSLQLLLVEDDHLAAQALGDLLRAQGHQVVHAGHALGALAELVRSRFDAALLDLDLPGMDGIALAAQIRAMGLDLPLVAVTGRSSGDEPEAMEQAHIACWLRKPVNGQQLRDCLARLCPRDAIVE